MGGVSPEFKNALRIDVTTAVSNKEPAIGTLEQGGGIAKSGQVRG
jgi:hypothetical protein